LTGPWAAAAAAAFLVVGLWATRPIARLEALARDARGPVALWVVDAPLFLLLAQGLALWSRYCADAAGTAPPGPRSLLVPITVTGAVCVLWGAAGYRRVHPYALSGAAISLLAVTGHATVGVAVGMGLLLCLQGYESYLWRLIGLIDPRDEPGGAFTIQEHVLAGTMWAAFVLSLCLWSSRTAMAVTVVFLVLTLPARLGCVPFSLPPPPFSAPGLDWLQRQLAVLTVRGVRGPGGGRRGPSTPSG
jgi:hypothetical protein